MKNISIYFLILLLVFSSFPEVYQAETLINSDDEEKVVLLADEIEGEIPLLDTQTNEILLTIPDYTEVILLDIIGEKDEAFALIRYEILNDEEMIEDEETTEATTIEGLVAISYVYEIEEAESIRNNSLEEFDEKIKEGNLDNIPLKEPKHDSNEEDTDGETAITKSNIVTKAEFGATTFSIQSKPTSTLSLANAKQSSTSRLGHLKGGERFIYPRLGGNAFIADASHKNKVYYIKRQAIINNQTYFLISEKPSATEGVVGWVKSSDLSTHTHKGVDKKRKTFLIKGNGKATTKAWGGSKDTVYSSMTKYRNHVFTVNLTEKVGSNTWYRGVLDGKQVWLHSSYVVDANIKSTSRLGHIKSSNVDLYDALGGNKFKAGTQYTNAVYYIKAEARYQGTLYYLLSTRPSASQGVVGWARASDLSTHAHAGVDKKGKTFYIKGNGKATTKAWGGNKDAVYSSLSKYKNRVFMVNLTEKVGNNIWYRGILDGKQVWLHSSYVHSPKVSSASLLGHFRGGDRNFHRSLGGDPVKVDDSMKNKVYYIKRQAVFGSGSNQETYYLLSTRASDSVGVVGWVKSTDLSTNEHVSVNKKSQILIINGTGQSFLKAWGGKQDLAYDNMQPHAGKAFHVNLTEKVGKNTWYRGKIENQGNNIWVHSSYVTKSYFSNTTYNTTFNEAFGIQKSRLNLTQRNGSSAWVSATDNEIRYYMNPANFANDPVQKFQFLVLSKPSGASTSQLNKLLQGKGVLSNKGKVFYDEARKHGLNEIYLIAHAQLETGNGTSLLSNGSIEVGLISNDKYFVQINKKDAKGNLKPDYHVAEYKTVTSNGNSSKQWVISGATASTRNSAKSIRKTYNMFGIGAYDQNANVLGAITAYQKGWNSVDNAIKGGIAWIRGDYIYNAHNQNTLYKMRWNPRMHEGYAWKQYASDIGWAYKQARIIHGMYNQIGKVDSFHFDIPKYR